MDVNLVNLDEKFDLIKDLHSYKVVAQMNDYYFKLVKAKREFVWHQHPETDEVFMVLDGTLTIELRDKTLTLNKNELVVIPKGVEHKPSCTQECKIMLIEPKTTLNTGNTQNKLTDTKLRWI
ncbi:MAG: cupin domain-containing protein [Candidatus Bathyarchaeota archaeon]|nr:cupin domain-containing protein [Candidatus Bathyarchaeum tardum]